MQLTVSAAFAFMATISATAQDVLLKNRKISLAKKVLNADEQARP